MKEIKFKDMNTLIKMDNNFELNRKTVYFSKKPFIIIFYTLNQSTSIDLIDRLSIFEEKYFNDIDFYKINIMDSEPSGFDKKLFLKIVPSVLFASLLNSTKFREGPPSNEEIQFILKKFFNII